MILSDQEFNAIMAAFPLCTRTSSFGKPKRAIPLDGPVAELVEHVKVRDNYPRAHAYQCRPPGMPLHFHIGTTKKRRTWHVASDPSKGDRT